MQIPAIEKLFAAPWNAAARRVLPSASPQMTATAIWGPVLGWCVLELLAASIDVENPESVALEIFDRLRLREPLAQAFAKLGFEGEEGWRVAARIKVLLLVGAGVGQPDADAKSAEDAAQDTGVSVKGTGFSPYIEESKSAGALAPEETQSEEEEAAGAEAQHSIADSSARLKSCPDTKPESNERLSAVGDSVKGSGISPYTQEPNQAEISSNADELLLNGSKCQGTTSVVPHGNQNQGGALAPAESIPSALWLDPDLRWLTGVHEAEGHDYLVRERYEELLWWLLLPSLLKLAGKSKPDQAAVQAMSNNIDAALAAAEAAGYRVDRLAGTAADEGVVEEPVPVEIEETETIEPEADETVSEPAIDSAPEALEVLELSEQDTFPEVEPVAEFEPVADEPPQPIEALVEQEPIAESPDSPDKNLEGEQQ
jgi:hypothetical protein